MRLGRIFTAAAKGRNPPSPGVFHWYNDSYVDPLAGTPAAAAGFAERGSVDSPYWEVPDEDRESPEYSAEHECVGNLYFGSDSLPGLDEFRAPSPEDVARLHVGDSPYRQGVEEGWPVRDAVPDEARRRDVSFEGSPAGSGGREAAKFGGGP